MSEARQGLFIAPKAKKSRKGRRLPAPRRSARLYFTIAPDKAHLLRYLLEAEDNLGLMTVVDRWRAAVMLRFSPQQEARVRAFLKEAGPLLDLQGPLPPVGLTCVPAGSIMKKEI